MKKNIFRKIAITILLVVLACFSACSDEEVVSSLKLDNEKLNLNRYYTTTIKAEKINIEEPTVWALVGDENVVDMTVSEDYSSAEIYTKTDGTVTVKVSAGEYSAECVVVVDAKGSVPVLSADKTLVEIVEGSTLQVTPSVKYEGQVMDKATFAYKIVNEKVATVDGGVVKGVKCGQTTLKVTATFNDFTDVLEIPVVVKDDVFVLPSQNSIVLYEKSEDARLASVYAYEKEKGQDFTIKVFQDGAEVTNPTLRYSNKDENVAVYKNGKIYAVGVGATQIEIVYHKNGIDYVGVINVEVLSVPEVKLNVYSELLELYTTAPSIAYKNKVAVENQVTINGEPISQPQIVWTTADDAVASVDQNGNITANGVGQTTVTATFVHDGLDYVKTIDVYAYDAIKQSSTDTLLNLKKYSTVYMEEEITLPTVNAKNTPFLEMDIDVMNLNINCDSWAYGAGKVKPVGKIYVKIMDSVNEDNFIIVQFKGNDNTCNSAGYYSHASVDGKTFKGWMNSSAFATNPEPYMNLNSNNKGLYTADGSVKLSYENGVLYMWSKNNDPSVDAMQYVKLIEPRVDLDSNWAGFTSGKVKIATYIDSEQITEETARAQLTIKNLAANNAVFNIGVHKGATVTLEEGKKVVYNGEVDLTGKTVSDMFIEYQIVPSVMGKNDVTSIYIELVPKTYAEKSTLIFKDFYRNDTTNERNQKYNFIFAGANNRFYSCLGNTVKNNPEAEGFSSYASFTGRYLVDADTSKGFGLAIDITTGRVCAKNNVSNSSSNPINCFMQYLDYTPVDNNDVVINNNKACISSEDFNGFASDGKYSLRIWADGYQGSAPAQVLIQSINGQKVTANDFSVT